MQLKFYDHDRQNYADTVERRDGTIGDFMVASGRGEFAIRLYDFEPGRSPWAIQFCVFDDAHDEFLAAMAAGLLDAIRRQEIRSRDEFSRLLIGLGFEDTSDNALEHGYLASKETSLGG